MILSGDVQSEFPSRELTFEGLLLEISAHFINLPFEEIDREIEGAQRLICKHLDLDLSALWQWSDKDSRMMTITHLYAIEGGPERPLDINADESFPWVLQRMLEGETLAYSTDQLPDEADLDKKSRSFFGVQSSVNVPLMTGNDPLLGVLTFDTLNRDHCWSENEIKRLKLVAEVFCNALARKRSELKLIESEARLALAADSAGAGMWELDHSTGIFWSTDQALEIFGYAPDEVITLDRFEQSVLPDDLLSVRQALWESFEKKKKLKIEYRIITENNETKWICSSGQPYFYKDGSPARILGISVDISDRKRLEEDLKNNFAEIKLLKQQIEQENYYLRKELKSELGFEHIIGQSKKFKAVLSSARQVAPTTATVLLLGETGTGKGVIAHAIHQMSDRSSQPFVTVNCAALPHNLIESELFGREKGAFTGAHSMQVGRFEIANRGTIFLDEIGEMSLEMQTKLLGVLQDGVFERLGSPKTVKVDIRVIAATARNLKKNVKEGRFREDLYYRLKVFPITIPPLRQRKDDISLLAQHFIEKYARKIGKVIDSISKQAKDKLQDYSWPGNVRELEHLIERSVITCPGSTLVIAEQLIPTQAPESPGESLKDLASLERDHIEEVLRTTNWKIEGPDGASSILDIHPSTLRYRLKKLNIKRPA